MSLSEIVTIAIAFHGSGFRTFKEFYTLQVLPHWKKAFPDLVSYNRFIELMPWGLMLLCCFLQTRTGEVTGISFVDSTPIEVCHPCRSRSHKVFRDIAGWGKNSMGWHAASSACVTQWTNATHSSLAKQDDGADAPYLGAYALRFKLHLIIQRAR